MAEEVKVKIVADADGAITSVEAAGDAFEELEDAQDEATASAERQADAQKEAANAAEQGADAQKDLATASEQSADAQNDTKQAAERAANAQREAASAAEKQADAQRQVSSTGGTANEILFSTGDAIQDAQFGFAGAANNISFVAENFAQLSQKSGGARSALRGVLSALKGTGGAILGLQAALLVVGPLIDTFFDSFLSDAEDAEEASSDVKQEIRSLFDFEQADLDQIDADIERVKQRLESIELGPGALRAQEIFPDSPAENIRTAIKTLDELDSQNVEILPRGDEIKEIVSTVEAVENPAQNARKALVSILRDFRRDSPETRQEIEDLEGGLKSLQKQRNKIADEVRRQNALRQAGVTTLEEEEKATSDLANEKERLRQELAGGDLEPAEMIPSAQEITTPIDEAQNTIRGGLQQSIQTVDASLTRLSEAFARAIGQKRRREILKLMARLKNLKKVMRGQQEEQLDIGNVLQRGQKQSIGNVNAALSELNTRLEEAGSPEKRAKIRKQIQQLQGLKGEMQGTSEEMINIGGMASDAMTQGITAAITAAVEGGNVLSAVGGVIGSFLQQVGKAIIAYGVAMESFKKALSNPFLAIAAGGALIAAGALVKSLVSSGPGGNGGGSDDGAQGADRPEGGGEGGVTVEGRAEGGPVSQGTPYMVGEEGPELFVPRASGKIVPNALGSASRRRGMRVQQQTDVSVDVTEPELFDLTARINESQRILDRVARQ